MRQVRLTLGRALSRREFVATLALGVAGLAVACGEPDSGGSGGRGSGGAAPTAAVPPTPSPAASPTGATPTGATLPTPTCDASGSPVAGGNSDIAAVAGCDAPIAHPLGADELVLRVDMTGGFVMPSYRVTQVPMFSLFGDGSVVTQGPQAAIYPGPALPNLRVTRLTEAGVQAVLRAARDAGLLDGDQTWEKALVADAPNTVFTANAGGRTSVTSVYALGVESAPPPDITQAEIEARQRLQAFENTLGDVAGWLPADAIASPDAAFEVRRLRIVVQPAEAEAPATATASPDATPDDPSLTPSVAPWPLGTPLAQWGDPYNMLNSRCGVVEGADLAPMLDALRNANQLTVWESAGQRYTALIRPLLPDEQGCAPVGQ